MAVILPSFPFLLSVGIPWIFFSQVLVIDGLIGAGLATGSVALARRGDAKLLEGEGTPGPERSRRRKKQPKRRYGEGRVSDEYKTCTVCLSALWTPFSIEIRCPPFGADSTSEIGARLVLDFPSEVDGILLQPPQKKTAR